MSDEGDGPIDPDLMEQMRRHHLAFERPETVVQPAHRQNRHGTGDKNSGRKPSANHSTKEDVEMNTGTSVMGRDAAVSMDNGVAVGNVSPDQIREVAAYYARMEAKINEISNPLSLTNGVKYAIGAGVGVGLYFSITGIVSLFKGPDVVVAKPAVMGK